MTPFGENHRHQERIGAFLLGKLDAGELEAMQTHLDGCPVCQAEVRELEPVIAGLADAARDRIDENPSPPRNLEESTLAPILGEIHRARTRRRSFRWSAVAAAAILVVVMCLAGLTGLVEPAVATEPLLFTVAPGMEDVRGGLIAHASGTEIRLVVPGARSGQTYRVTLVSEDGKRVPAGTFIGAGDEPVRGTFNAALPRKDATKLEVRTTDGELEFYAKILEEPRDKVREWPLFGILPWADPGLQNETMKSKTMEPGGPESPGGPTQKGPKDPGGDQPPSGPPPSAPPDPEQTPSAPPDPEQTPSAPPDPEQTPSAPPDPEQTPRDDQYKPQL